MSCQKIQTDTDLVCIFVNIEREQEDDELSKIQLVVYLYVCISGLYILSVDLYVMQQAKTGEREQEEGELSKVQTGHLGWFAEIRPSHLVW